MTGRGRRGLCAAAVLLGAMVLLSGCAGVRESDAVSNAMLAIGDRDFEGAVKTLEAAEKDGEHSRSLFRALGIAEMGMGDYESAAGYLEKALTKSSGIPDDCDFDINFYLASCYFKLGRNEDARDVDAAGERGGTPAPGDGGSRGGRCGCRGRGFPESH